MNTNICATIGCENKIHEDDVCCEECADQYDLHNGVKVKIVTPGPLRGTVGTLTRIDEDEDTAIIEIPGARFPISLDDVVRVAEEG